MSKTYYIYKATNLINGKSYIGQTSDVKRRIWQHWRCYEKESCVFHDAIEEFGFKNFEWEILSEVDSRHQAIILEKQYIKMYSTMIPGGYNMNKGGVGGHNARPVVCLSLNGEFVKRYDSACDTEIDGFYNSDVLKNCRRESHSCKGHLFMFEDEYKRTGPIENEDINYDYMKKKVIQCDKDGKYIAEFPSVLDASIKTGVTRARISSVLTKRGKHAGGYIWVYAEDFPITEISNYHTRKKGVPIIQIDPDTERIIGYYDSVADAGRSLGVSYKAIHKVLDKPFRTAYGYKWKKAK